MFKFSNKDAWLVLAALGHIGFTTWVTLTSPPAFTGVTGVWVVLGAFGMCTGYQCIAHNFIHHPFFASERLNFIFSLLSSLVLGLPQTIYRFHHLEHHKYNNDAPDERTGKCLDASSTYRWSRQTGKEESLLSYALLTVFRADVVSLARRAQAKGLGSWVGAETLVLLTWWGVMAALNWRGFLWVYLPLWYLGQVMAAAENYLEHHKATPGDRMADSVSCYGQFYNWIWFNNGYHQEHHFKPQVHWTQLPALRHQLPEHSRRIVRGAHWFNLETR